jgi:hypothetical protein
VSDMLGETDRGRQSTGGPAESARMPPRGAGTTASAAPPSRSYQGVAAPDLGGAGPELLMCHRECSGSFMFWWHACFRGGGERKAAETFGENVVATETRARRHP